MSQRWVEDIRVDKLKEHPNYLRGNVQPSSFLVESLMREGLVVPLIVEQGTNYVYDGVQRLRAIRQLGWETCKCELLTREQIRERFFERQLFLKGLMG